MANNLEIRAGLNGVNYSLQQKVSKRDIKKTVLIFSDLHNFFWGSIKDNIVKEQSFLYYFKNKNDIYVEKKKKINMTSQH